MKWKTASIIKGHSKVPNAPASTLSHSYKHLPKRIEKQIFKKIKKSTGFKKIYPEQRRNVFIQTPCEESESERTKPKRAVLLSSECKCFYSSLVLLGKNNKTETRLMTWCPEIAEPCSPEGQQNNSFLFFIIYSK